MEGFAAPRAVLGWAIDPAAPAEPVPLLVRLHGEEVTRLSAGIQDRPELFGAARGFLLDLPPAYAPGDLARGAITIHPLHAGQVLPPLPLRPRLLAQEEAAAGHALLTRAEATLGPQGLSEMLAVLGRVDGFGAARLAAAANAALAEGLRGQRPADARLSPLRVPVGARSGDGSVLVGAEGQLFLLAGSNGELAQLGADPAQRARLVEAWLGAIEARRARAESHGVHFLQLIVPETASLVPDLLPDPAQGGPTPLLAALEAALAARRQLAACVVLGGAAMTAAAREAGLPLQAMVRRLDSHPSAPGMHALARAVLQRLGERPPDVGPRFRRRQLATGDLAGRFLPLPLFEETLLLPAPAFAGFGAEPALVAEGAPPDGGHIGRHEHWRATRAPSPRRLLCFGNSVCGTGRAGQALLSGWLARWFAEYRFHWQPAVDWDLVTAVRPDILLCQTVERFMGRLPEA